MADKEGDSSFLDKLKAYARTRKGTILAVEIVSDLSLGFLRHFGGFLLSVSAVKGGEGAVGSDGSCQAPKRQRHTAQSGSSLRIQNSYCFVLSHFFFRLERAGRDVCPR